jgi:hypothetical protein
MPFTDDNERRSYQKLWIADKRQRQRARAKLTLGDILRAGRRLREQVAAEQAKPVPPRKPPIA